MATNFNELSRQQMVEAAERFGITVDGRWSDKSLAGALLNAGVTMDQINSAEEVLSVTEGKPSLSDTEAADDLVEAMRLADDGAPAVAESTPVPQEAPAPEAKSSPRVVLKMERNNKSYSIMGHKFTEDHPFIVMDEEEALWIADTVDGFRIAHPTEAAKFYKKG